MTFLPSPFRTQDMYEKLERVNDEIQQLENDLEEHQSERSIKYKELKKKEAAINGECHMYWEWLRETYITNVAVSSVRPHVSFP